MSNLLCDETSLGCQQTKSGRIAQEPTNPGERRNRKMNENDRLLTEIQFLEGICHIYRININVGGQVKRRKTHLNVIWYLQTFWTLNDNRNIECPRNLISILLLFTLSVLCLPACLLGSYLKTLQNIVLDLCQLNGCEKQKVR